MSTPNRSLARRLLIASLIALPLFTGIIGAALESAYRQSQQASIREQMQSALYLLMAAAEVEEDGQLYMPERLQDPRLDRLNTGLLATISRDRKELWRSPSADLADFTLSAEAWSSGEQIYYQGRIEGDDYFILHQDVEWENNGNQPLPLRFNALLSQRSFHEQLLSYRTTLWQWLGALSLMLLLTQWAILRWGLRPLQQVAADLENIERGQDGRLNGDYPAEITPVIDNLNRVLDSEQQQRERYRNTMADLAHSLKTPLAVIRSQLQGMPNPDSPENRSVEEQVQRMDQIVQHQLKRAIRSQQSSDSQTPVSPLAKRLTSALGKIQSSSVNFEHCITDSTLFAGDSQDLMEVMGNLLENACKYGSSHIRISASNPEKAHLNVTIEDNGPGIPENQREVLLQRGERADTATSGQGIGLAVVIDIISSYNGSMEIGESDLGGARFDLSFR